MTNKLKFLSVFFFTIFTASQVQAAKNPFDNLSAAEVKMAKRAVQASKRFSGDVQYRIVQQQEPSKADVLAGKAKRAIFLALFEPKKNELFEVTVDLATKEVASIVKIEGAQPSIAFEEFDELSSIVKADPCWQAAVKRRGYGKLKDFEADGWAPGLLSEEELKSGARIMRALTYYKGKNNNMYSRPVEGIHVSVDMNQKKVVECKDYELVPVANGPNDFDMIPPSKQRKGLHLISYSQPEGPSYKLQGQKVDWVNWSFQFSFSAMKALQLHQISYKDGKKQRSILYKIGLSEMVVPYGDADKNWAFRNAFDVGEYGLGRTAHSLVAGVDVPAHAKLFDATLSDWKGNPIVIPRAVALYERPAGVLWKHTETGTQHTDVRTAQELVVTFMTTIGNYDYGVSYVLGLDGSIHVEARLTGILLAKGSALVEVPCTKGCAPLVEKKIITPPHQHFFSFRMDFDIDGTNNTPYEMDSRVVASSNNPYNNAFEKVNTILEEESDAARDLNPASARMWKVSNENKTNGLNHPTGYGLMPGENSVPYLGEDSLIRKRAQFVNHQMWFTRYHDHEQSSAGDYPNQSKGGDGLPQFQSNDEKLRNQDVVAWYTFGVTHHPRPEEWPIMSVHKTGFSIIPIHFFDQNPSMDLPAPRKKQ